MLKLYFIEGKDEHRKGLLTMKMAEGAKLQMCYLLHHLCDIQLRHRVESIIAFSHDFVGDLQADQLRRYVEVKQSDLPSAVAAKKTREFRCPPREQMNAILGFKNMEEDEENSPCGGDLREKLNEFHEQLMGKVSLNALIEPEAADGDLAAEKPGPMKKLYNFINAVKEMEEVGKPYEEPEKKTPEEIFRKVLIKTIVSWAEESQIETPKLVREMFSLLVRQYDTVGELIRALEKTYVINAKTKDDVAAMWIGLSQIRALLPVQMSQEEEELMRKRLWKLVNNHTFFQHPDLIRILRVHENVMAVMMNTLGKFKTTFNTTVRLSSLLLQEEEHKRRVTHQRLQQKATKLQRKQKIHLTRWSWHVADSCVTSVAVDDKIKKVFAKRNFFQTLVHLTFNF